MTHSESQPPTATSVIQERCSTFMMKFLIIAILFVSISVIAQNESPLFTKWELYKESERINCGSSGEAVPQNIKLDLSERFTELNLQIVFPKGIAEKVNHEVYFLCINSDKIIDTIKVENLINSNIKISKRLLSKLKRKCKNEQVALIYSNDSVSPGFIFILELIY